MANEDDSVKSSSFAIFIWVSVSDFISHIHGDTLERRYNPEMKPRCSFLAKMNLRPPESAFLFIAFQKQRIRNGSGQFLLIVGYHNQGFILPRTECLDDILHQPAVTHIQSVQRLVQNQ